LQRRERRDRHARGARAGERPRDGSAASPLLQVWGARRQQLRHRLPGVDQARLRQRIGGRVERRVPEVVRRCLRDASRPSRSRIRAGRSTPTRRISPSTTSASPPSGPPSPGSHAARASTSATRSAARRPRPTPPS
jgi:hypothetical protein